MLASYFTRMAFQRNLGANLSLRGEASLKRIPVERKQATRSSREADGSSARVTPVISIALALACAQGGDAPLSHCNTERAAAQYTSPSQDLYCMHLTAAPGLSDSVSAIVELAHPGGPFSLAVDSAGSQKYEPRITILGLPQPAELDPSPNISGAGRYSTYIAWVTTPVMSPLIKLGEVSNGLTVLPTISLDKFVILVSAERNAATTEREGRLVLRGGSPSTRMQPPDVQEFTLGGMVDSGSLVHTDSNTHANMRHGAPDSPGLSTTNTSARWTTVPMPTNLTMLPAEMTLRPAVSPWLPGAGRVAAATRATEVIRVKNGDTLTLTARIVQRNLHGRPLAMYAFNNQIPGPFIRAAQNDVITVNFHNEIDQPSTIHWHGLRLEHQFDGVPHLSQQPVAPGDSFAYRIRFPDTGVYWYHSHVREDMQQDLGLAGNMMVSGDPSLSPVHREEILLLDDMLIGADGPVPYGESEPTHALMGRFGNVILVNGEPRWRATVRPGEVLRFWFTNAAATRTFNLSFTNARMKLVAGDMSAFSRDEWVNSVVISPAERYAVDVKFLNGGVPAVLLNRVMGIDHLFGDFFPETDTLGVVNVSNEAVSDATTLSFDSLRVRTQLLREMDVASASVIGGWPAHTLAFGLRTRGVPFFTQRMMQLDSSYFHPVEWSGTMPMMNWATTASQARWFIRHAASGAENDSIILRFRRGEVARIRLVNERNSIHAMQHPVHFHGQRLLVESVNGVAPSSRSWKDTVLLPAGATMDILVEFSNPGRWMLHCHIAEHIGAGMMTTFEVTG